LLHFFIVARNTNNSELCVGRDFWNFTLVGFEVPAMPCSQVEADHLIALMMKAASTLETLVNFYQAVWHYDPENSLL
jgi:hypothetical protein